MPSSTSPFDALKKKLVGRPSAATIAAALDDLAAIKSGLQDRHAALAQARADSLLTADESALAKGREAMGVISDQLEIAAAFRTKLAADHVAVLAAEEDARRRDVYTAAAAKIGKAAKLAASYDKAARETLAAVRAMAEASIIAAEANAALPEGAEPLDDAFNGFAMAASGFLAEGLPREVLSEKQVERWCFLGTWDVVGDQTNVEVDGNNPNRGQLRSNRGGGQPFPVAGVTFVEKRTFIETTTLPPTYNQWADTFTASNLALPGLFTPPGGAFAPSDAASFIAAIDDALANRANAAPPKRTPKVELRLLTADGVILEAAA